MGLVSIVSVVNGFIEFLVSQVTVYLKFVIINLCGSLKDRSFELIINGSP